MKPNHLATSFLIAAALPAVASAQATAPTLFVANGSNDSVSSLTINPDGTLKLTDTLATQLDPDHVSVSPDGRFLAVPQNTDLDFDRVSILEVSPGGLLSTVTTLQLPTAALDSVWVDNDTLAVAGTQIGSSFVRTYDLDATVPSLSFIDQEATGSFTTDLQINGNVLYANNSFGGNTVEVLSVSDAGDLVPIESQPSGDADALTFALTPAGEFLYSGTGITGITDNEILGYSVNSDGTLELLPATQSPFRTPNEVAVSGDGSILAVGHSEGTLATFAIAGDGSLSFTGNSTDFGSGIDLADIETLGGLLFLADSNEQVIRSYDLGSDGSFSEIVGIASGGTGYRDLAVWRGIPEPMSAALVLPAALLLWRRR
jgi:6-phosphogluconolactonase (cycloisomerase 2 family)